MANVIITTYDGKVYTNPEDIKVERNENTEMFYSSVMKEFKSRRPPPKGGHGGQA